MSESSVSPIADAIVRLRQLSQQDIRDQWRVCEQDLTIAEGCDPTRWQDWAIAPQNDKGYILWERGHQVRWLCQDIIVPHDLHGYPLAGMVLRLALTVWTDPTHVFVNGNLVQECDLFDHSPRILLAASVTPGDRISVALRLVSPGHDDGALMKSLCLYEAGEAGQLHDALDASLSVPAVRCPLSLADQQQKTNDEGRRTNDQGRRTNDQGQINEPGFVADELAVLEIYLTALAPEKIALLADVVAAIAWDAVGDRPRFEQSIDQLYDRLQPLSDWLKQRQISVLGHSHLDLVWLWTWAETCDVAERMFKSVLSLQQDFSALTFCHSSPALYAWIEEHRPVLFTAIRDQVQAGRWEPLGGMWVEPELNLLNGESLVRQVLYGQRYVQSRFGRLDTIAWLPDSFGFCWQLPQILSQGGIEYLVTQKLTWNDRTKFPHAAFWWQAPDGSRVFTVMSSMVGEGIDPVKMATYASQWEHNTGLPHALWLFGVGDHGGGPTRDMLEVAERWRRSSLFPQLTTSSAADYLQEVCHGSFTGHLHNNSDLSLSDPAVPRPSSSVISNVSTNKGQDSHPFPTWNDEIYLECHRGSYTTHGDQKRWNRCCETLLYQAELWSSLVTIATHSPYPKADLDSLWKALLFNQFHDILPGSSIPEVFVEANQAWRFVEETATVLRDRALEILASHIVLPAPPYPDCQPIVVVNSLNWARSGVVGVRCQGLGVREQVFDTNGQSLESQTLASGELAFLAEAIPSVGYRVFWLRSPELPLTPNPSSSGRGEQDLLLCSQQEEGLGDEGAALENECLRVMVDSKTGDLSSVFDKTTQREILSGAGNQLQAFADQHKYWDAWNIDPDYEQHPLPPSELQSMHWVDRGLICQRLRVVRTIANSTFQQDYVLEVGSPVLRIETIADWQDYHIILKAAFPLAAEANHATYEIPCGAIDRPTHSEDPMQQAKWEVPALRWADLAGVSLLNDCKYAYDSKPNQLRLTLLRGSCWPDPHADLGHHAFTYALYAHAGNWQQAQTVRHGYALNQPLQVVQPSSSTTPSEQTLPPVSSLLDLQAENLVLMALKPCEDEPTQWLLRCYEAQGRSATLDFASDLGMKLVDRVDVLERSTSDRQGIDRQVSDPEIVPITIAPWQIASVTAQAIR